MPSPSLVHVTSSLTQVAYQKGARTYAASEVFPELLVEKETGIIFGIDPDDETHRLHDSQRAPGTEAHRIDISLDKTISYTATDHSLADVLADEVRANADAGAQPALDLVSWLSEMIRNEQEKRLVDKLVANLTGTTLTASPTNKWDDYTSGDPIGDILNQKNLMTIRADVPTIGVLSSALMTTIGNHPDFIDRSKHTATPMEIAATGPQRILASILGLQEIIVVDAVINNAIKGQAASMAFIWSDSFLLARREPPRVACNVIGVTPVWNVVSGGGGFYVTQMRDEKARGEWTNVGKYYDQITLRAAASANIPGFLFTNCAAGY